MDTCQICESDNLTDSILCPRCASARHFTDRADCSCVPCRDARNRATIEREILERAAWNEEGRVTFGWSFPAAA